jgi:hypothetical protein
MSQAMDLGADRAVRAVLIVVADVALLARPTRPLHSEKVYYVNFIFVNFLVFADVTLLGLGDLYIHKMGGV